MREALIAVRTNTRGSHHHKPDMMQPGMSEFFDSAFHFPTTLPLYILENFVAIFTNDADEFFLKSGLLTVNINHCF